MRPTLCQLALSLNVGGAEVLVSRLAELARKRFRVVVACLDESGPLGEELRNAGHSVVVLGRRPGVDLACSHRFARLCRDQGVRLVHAHQYAPFFYAAVARLRLPRMPILFTEHGRELPDWRRPKRVAANRLLLRRRDRIVAVGEHVRRALIDNEGLPPKRIEIVYNGVPTRSGLRDERIRREVRGQLGLAPSTVAIAQVARLDPIKDHATALRAMARLRAAGADAQWIAVGAGPERTRLEALAATLDLRGRVRFLGERRDVERLLQAFDVALLTSRSEGTPLTLLEAMAASLPCVATDVGGTPEVVVPGETGLLSRAGDDEALAARLQTLVRSPDLRARMGRRGRRRVEAHFDADVMEHGYLERYREMLAP